MVCGSWVSCTLAFQVLLWHFDPILDIIGAFPVTELAHISLIVLHLSFPIIQICSDHPF